MKTANTKDQDTKQSRTSSLAESVVRDAKENREKKMSV